MCLFVLLLYKFLFGRAVPKPQVINTCLWDASYNSTSQQDTAIEGQRSAYVQSRWRFHSSFYSIFFVFSYSQEKLSKTRHTNIENLYYFFDWHKSVPCSVFCIQSKSPGINECTVILPQIFDIKNKIDSYTCMHTFVHRCERCSDATNGIKNEAITVSIKSKI